MAASAGVGTAGGGAGSTLHTDDREGIALLRGLLAEAGFTAGAVREALATEVANGRDSAELPLYERMLAGGGRLAALIRLFLLALPVSPAEAERALAPLGLERLVAMGVLEPHSPDGVRAAVELVPTEELVLACDGFRSELTQPDHVLGVSPPARLLAWLTVRSPVERVLDLGTGNGYQALLGARHADEVVAVDINPRALSFAAFNAALNAVEGVELRLGNLFEPVADEAFDLVVCNPPYVVSPETEIAYRDGGLRGDAFCEAIVRTVPAHLVEGGIGQVLVSWLHPREGDWRAPVQRWVEGSACDAVLLRYAADQPLDYAAGWNRPHRPHPERYGAALDRWLAYFDELGVETISWGALILRRRAGRNWFFSHDSRVERITGAGAHVLRLFAAQDYLAELGDQDLLAARFSLAGEHRVDQSLRLDPEGTLVERSLLRLDSGLRLQVGIDVPTERVLSLLDGVRPLGAILEQVAASPPGKDGETFVADALPVMRRLVELGFVLPVSGATP